MSEREPDSMAEYFAAEYPPQGASPSSVATDDQGADEFDDRNYADSAPVDRPLEATPPTPESNPQEIERLARIEQELIQLRTENARKDQQLAEIVRGARQGAEEQRSQEILRARSRWERGIATGELSESDVIREREQLIARHATDRITSLETENYQLRAHQINQQEQEAKVQTIQYLGNEFALTDRELKYLEKLNDPYAMEALAQQFREDRQTQTSSARETLAQNRRQNPVDRSPRAPSGSSRGPEPKSMQEYFSGVHRGAGR